MLRKNLREIMIFTLLFVTLGNIYMVSVVYADAGQCDNTEFHIKFTKRALKMFSRDFVDVYIEFVIDDCPSNVKFVMACLEPPENPQEGYGVTFYEIPPVVDRISNRTIFTYEGRIPWTWNGEQFPYDNYTLMLFLGIGPSYKFVEEEQGWAWFESPSPNYECLVMWSYLGNRSELLKKWRIITGEDMPHIYVEDEPDSWQIHAIIVRHSPDFIRYANRVFNRMSIIIVLPFIALSIITLLSFVARARLKRKWGFTTYDFVSKFSIIAITVSIGMITFIPLYQLSISGLKYPLLFVEADNNFICAFYLYVATLIFWIFLSIIQLSRKSSKT